MAGFHMLWINEFVEEARAVYRLNAAPQTVIDPRDIREITPADVLDAIGLRPGDLDLMDGSPPCASFSTAGRMEEHWGKTKRYSSREQRTDDLFYEFIRLLTGIQPRVFVAENVSGLVRGTSKGQFIEILGALKDAGYQVEAKMLDAQWLGVPQVRKRLIFVGVRNDLGRSPVFPKPLPYRYTVRDALPWIRRIEVDRRTSAFGVNAGAIYRPGVNEPLDTVTANGISGDVKTDWTVEAETDISRYAIGSAWEDTPVGGHSERYFMLKRLSPDMPARTITAEGGNASIAAVTHPYEKRKFSIAELRRLCGFPDDFQLVGSYAQRWERLGRAVPPPMMRVIAETIRDRLLSEP